MMVVMAARRGRPTAAVELSGEERQTLERWARRPCTTQSLAMRTRIVLACAEGKTNQAVAREVGTSPQTVCKWRGRFQRDRLPGLADEYRSGVPPTITGEMVERVLIKTLEEKPRDATHWSTRGMAKEVGLSRSSVQRIWHTFELQPHRSDTFKISSDPLFVDKVWDITGLYLNPPEAAAVLCVDEKSRSAARYRGCSRPVSAARPPNRTCPFPSIRLSTTSAGQLAISRQPIGAAWSASAVPWPQLLSASATVRRYSSAASCPCSTSTARSLSAFAM